MIQFKMRALVLSVCPSVKSPYFRMEWYHNPTSISVKTDQV